jgi:hypothetical protein
MQDIPAAVAPVAGLITVAVVVAPVEYWQARRRLQRWARARGWRHSRDGRPWIGIARQVIPAAHRIGPVVSGTFAGRQVTAFQVTVAHAADAGHGTRQDRGDRPTRYVVVAIRAPGACHPFTVMAGPNRTGPATSAVHHGWVLTWAPTRSPAETINELLPSSARVARELPRFFVTAA